MLTPEQAWPIEGVAYDAVPTFPLPKEDEGQEPADDRWAFKVQPTRPQRRRPGQVIVHIWDCPKAPAGADEVDLFDALEVLRSTAGAVTCKECGASLALNPLVQDGD
ncbi:DUF6233 domain-containing protein [Streptomyces sp. NPDC005708]|uniref:DUF6233 domain-containing protein n=1 Tax=unclassified Streptomyces TaxID=2593676 RepID=UPI0033DE80F7